MPLFKKNGKLLKYSQKGIEIVVLAVALYFVGHYILLSWTTVKSSLNHINWGLLFIAWLFFLVYFLMRSIAWRLVLKILGINIGIIEATRVWFLSEFSRYIPGNIWSVLGRVHLSKEHGIAPAVTLASMLIEIIFLVGTALVFLTIFVMLWPYSYASSFRWLFIFAVPLIVILLSPNLVTKTINWVLIKMKKTIISFQFNRLQLFIVFITFATSWAAYGVASLVVMNSITPVGSISIFWLISSFVVAWLVGYLSFITPMGLGVRESVIIAILAPFINIGLASLVAIFTRVWLIVSELSLLCAVTMFRPIRNQ